MCFSCNGLPVLHKIMWFNLIKLIVFLNERVGGGVLYHGKHKVLFYSRFANHIHMPFVKGLLLFVPENDQILYMFCLPTAVTETKEYGRPWVYSSPWFKNEQDELIPNANHNPDSGHMSACDAACLCLVLHQEIPRQKAIAGSCLCILMSTPWEKYANSFCHQEENRGQESSRYRRGLREEGTCKRREWVCEFTCVCVCVEWGGVRAQW